MVVHDLSARKNFTPQELMPGFFGKPKRNILRNQAEMDRCTLHWHLLGENVLAVYHSSSQATSKKNFEVEKPATIFPAKPALSSICIGSKSTKYSTMRPNNTKAPSFVLKFLTPSHQREVVGIMRENRVWCKIYATKFLTYQNYMVWKNGISGFNYGAKLGQISAGVDHPFRMRAAFWMRANGLHVKV